MRKSDFMPLEAFPKDIYRCKIWPELDSASRWALSSASDSLWNKSEELMLEQLIKHVANGQQVSAEKITAKMARKNPQLLLKKLSFMDSAGRKFMSVCLLQLIEWIGDWPMKELLKYFPEAIKEQARAQLKEVREKGLEYEIYLALRGEITRELIEKDGDTLLDSRTSIILRGCTIILWTISAEAEIELERLQAISKEEGETPILIKHGNKIYLYGHPGKEWALTELNNTLFENFPFKDCGYYQTIYLATGNNIPEHHVALTEAMRQEIKKGHLLPDFQLTYVDALPSQETLVSVKVTHERRYDYNPFIQCTTEGLMHRSPTAFFAQWYYHPDDFLSSPEAVNPHDTSMKRSSEFRIHVTQKRNVDILRKVTPENLAFIERRYLGEDPEKYQLCIWSQNYF